MSNVTNPRSDTNVNQNTQPSGSKCNKSIGVHASNEGNSDSEQDDHPFRASDMRDLRNPARPFDQTKLNLDKTKISNEDSEADDYHNSIRNRFKLPEVNFMCSRISVGTNCFHTLRP